MADKFVFLKSNYLYDGYELEAGTVAIIVSMQGDIATLNLINPELTIKINKSKIESFNPLRTGDNFSNKVCNVCHRLLPVTEFDKNQNGVNNRTIRRPSCKTCRVVIDGKSMTAAEKRSWERRKPNLVIFECPVCHKRTIAGLTSKVVLDHNHVDGTGRGWICDSCNTGLGRFKDDVDLLLNAIKHIQEN